MDSTLHVCINTHGAFECECAIGYEDDAMIGRSDIDECATEKDECDENAACTIYVGSYTCACNIGFEGTGRICEDINECETGDKHAAVSTDTI